MKRYLLPFALLLAGAAQAQNMHDEEANIATLPALGGPTHAAPARELILRAGYEEVDDLKRGEDGRWHARAVRDGRPVKVTVGKDGTVDGK
jgi:hypothetical protein